MHSLTTVIPPLTTTIRPLTMVVERFYLYQKCLLQTFYGLCNISKVSKTSKIQLQTRPPFTAIALPGPGEGHDRRRADRLRLGRTDRGAAGNSDGVQGRGEHAPPGALSVGRCQAKMEQLGRF